ncbi:MAG: TRAP transporter small permease subunit [Alphaproteobacteria bacterium]|nr:TRAP transporter small permease subunit [Alphaproteobacteria bacterium]
MPDAKGLNPVVVFICRFGGLASVFLALVFILNNFLTYIGGLPGIYGTFGASGLFGFEAPKGDVSGGVLAMGWMQVGLALAAIVGAGYYTRSGGSLSVDADRMDKLASYIIRAAFWGVLLVGVADAVISFIRVEDLHTAMFGKTIATKLGLSSWRGMYIHIPLLLLGAVIAIRDKSVSVVWLILLVVVAELLIVLARFIFAYEQTFMGDLVRFWYASLFLFPSAYTLKQEGHLRVDVIFASFKARTQAWVNASGTVAFGIPLCWVVLLLGLSGKSSLINSPMLNFETSMSGFGMYVKYLMAAFLVVFALSMLIQFTSYFFNALAVMNNDDKSGQPSAKGA